MSAITELFNEGMADPRGCEYREVEITAGLGEGDVKTHGWVLPGDGKELFAVTWSGVVYPLKSAGPPADLKKDVTDLLARDQKMWGHYNPTNADIRGHYRVNEWMAITHDGLLPLKAALLLRLGRADLAEAVWKEWFFANAEQSVRDPYVLLANEWLQVAFDQASFAHMWGDDSLALAGFRKLGPVPAEVEAAATQRGIAKDKPGKPYVEGLDQLPALLADQERRAQEPPYVPVLQSGQPAQGPERIAALIHDLELVDARQMVNSGQTDVSTDPIVRALIEEGDPAVEPLIKCLEEDNRLTRSLFTFHMMGRGPMIPVYEPAFAAIVGILKTPFYFSDSDNSASNVFREPSDPRDRQPRDLSMADRKFLAGKIRAYWDRYKSVSLADRWYATLQDDNAGADAWFLAVDNIVQPTDISTTPRTMFGGGGSFGGVFPRKAPVVLQGESLRAKTNPIVSDLIIKRFKEVLAQSASDKNISFDPVGKLILALADWDGKAHLDDLREMAQAFHKRFPHEQGAFVSTLQTEAMIFRKRLALGDPRTLQDYADWLVAINPTEWCNFDLTNPFQIMWHYPNDPVIRQAAEKMFNGENSRWSPLNRVRPVNESSTLSDLATTPLIGLAAFRREVIRRLGDTSLDGTVQLNENGNVGCMLTDDVHQNFTVASCKDDPLAPSVSSSISFRTCDWFAYELSRLDGFPRIGLYWPQAQRDAAVAACKAVLMQYGDAFQAHPQDPYDESVYGSQDRARVAFPKIDHPATPDDVKLGHAIFSLPGTTRICHLPDFPIEAWRPSHKTDPTMANQTAPDGKTKYFLLYVTEGRVWQAEEVLVGGKWERYYGFVGRYQLEKVPAAEIRFSYQGADGNITKEISGTIEGPQDYVQGQLNFSFATHNFSQLDSPLPVKVKISNGSGVDQVVPAALMLPPGAKKTLPQGVSFSLLYSEKLPPKVTSFSEPPFNYGSWQDIPLRKEVQTEAGETPGPTLTPTQDFTVLNIDLRDFFDMSRPGTYRLKALFRLPGQTSVPS
ncbi:MAG: hypothetical protein LV479_13055, partial [Methylacidiphilales bacterium]|nr:hypothetical protein [Candidatus Methylacidiphilales bacterium]